MCPDNVVLLSARLCDYAPLKDLDGDLFVEKFISELPVDIGVAISYDTSERL